MALRGWLRRRRGPEASGGTRGRGLLLFRETSEAIRAEKLLKEAAYDVRMVAPPHRLRRGCDLAVEFELAEQLGVERVLRQGRCEPLEVVPVTEEALRPLELCHVKDFGRYLMVRAANMKLTFDKETQRIVNVSGGGCPDVPWLAWQMIGKPLREAPSPRDLGHTVCAYALWRAWEEAKARA